ncbi:hypothetical protein AOLI_G00022920 [Acnodon oligacanthus]
MWTQNMSWFLSNIWVVLQGGRRDAVRASQRPCEVVHDSSFDQIPQYEALSADIMHYLCLHGVHAQSLIVVQRGSRLLKTTSSKEKEKDFSLPDDDIIFIYMGSKLCAMQDSATPHHHASSTFLWGRGQPGKGESLEGVGQCLFTALQAQWGRQLPLCCYILQEHRDVQQAMELRSVAE